MVRVLAKGLLAIVALWLPMVLLPVDNAVWRQQLTVTAHVSMAAPTPTPEPPLSANVEIHPSSLNLDDEGKPVEAFVTLPAEYDPHHVDLGSVRLCTGTSPCGDRGVQPRGRANVDGGRLHLTFDRQKVIAMVEDSRATDSVTLTVSGEVNPPGRRFAGNDTIRLKGIDALAKMVLVPKGSPTPAGPTAPPTVTPTASGTPLAQMVAVTPSGTPTVTPTPPAATGQQSGTVTPRPDATASPDPTTAAVTPTTAALAATATIQPTATPKSTTTSVPTVTSQPTWASVQTAMPEATSTQVPMATPRPTSTPVSTATPQATSTSALMPTPKPTSTPKPAPTKAP